VANLGIESTQKSVKNDTKIWLIFVVANLTATKALHKRPPREKQDTSS